MRAADALDDALDRLRRLTDPAVVTFAVPATDLRELADEIDGRPAAEVPLRGTTFAIKDNIDLAGAPTTAACPSFASVPERSATVVERLVRAGALPVVKTNLDQFATGLVGTRSPYGAPRNPCDPALVPGGSSSGSAVAVATGLTTFALGTDTAGSGRVPAAMCGIVGVKPTPGRLSCAGVVPAVRSIDCVSVFAPTVALGAEVTALAAGFDDRDPFSRRPPHEAAGRVRRLGVLGADVLAALGVAGDVLEDQRRTRAHLVELGFELREVDPTVLLAIGDQLYGGPWLSERVAAVGDFVAKGAPDLDPVVSRLVNDGRAYTAVDVHRARYRVEALLHEARAVFDDVDALAFPTIGWHVTLDEIRRDPVEPNARLGRFTTFTNLAGLCAIAIPLAGLGRIGRPPPSLTLHGPGWADVAIADAARRIIGEPPGDDVPEGWVRLAVAGAHLRGEALDHQLLDRGARFVTTTATAPAYRLYAIDGSTPPKPALVHAGTSGAAIEVDVWALPAAAFGDFVDAVPSPLCIGKVELAGGAVVSGFLSEPRALDGATEITGHGGWRAYRRSTA